jgi:hypothetical protein
MAVFAELLPVQHGRFREIEIGDAQFGGARAEFRVFGAGFGKARQIALHVGDEDRHALRAEAFGHRAQRDGLARTRGAGDQTVTIGEFKTKAMGLAALGDRQTMLEPLRHAAVSNAKRGAAKAPRFDSSRTWAGFQAATVRGFTFT